ncbi:hypothetical protein NDU88_003282 [Pleurodeles waltl]|uniref:Uncharacterized protein n=1 Tax=Pleurodeles waltl TaxID=8319 RepID=A0AAV7SF66_PLEWA|nr:hypothetical protein NDU88_003282 [Pleurodeles waltl]
MKGQEQTKRGFKGENLEMDGDEGEDARSEEQRSVTRDEQGEPTKEENLEDLHAEVEAREAPCTRPSHI